MAKKQAASSSSSNGGTVYQRLKRLLNIRTGVALSRIRMNTNLRGSPGLGFTKDSLDGFLNVEVRDEFGVSLTADSFKPHLVGILSMTIEDKLG